MCPATVINQWRDELQTWSLPTMNAPEVFLFSDAVTSKAKVQLVKKVIALSGVLIVSYETLRCDNEIIIS